MFLYISSRTTDLFCGYEDSNTPVNTQKLSAFQVVVFDTRLVLITVMEVGIESGSTPQDSLLIPIIISIIMCQITSARHIVTLLQVMA